MRKKDWSFLVMKAKTESGIFCGQMHAFWKFNELCKFPGNLRCFSSHSENQIWRKTRNKLVGILVEKIAKGKAQIELVLKAKKVKVHQLQRLCGFLNFFLQSSDTWSCFYKKALCIHSRN